jgi:recombination protein RecT
MENKNTHTITKPNQKPSSLQVLKTRLAGDPLKQVVAYYSGNKAEAHRFMASAISYVRKVPKLLECSHESLITALVDSAQFRFMPSGVMGEAYIIPYASEAKFQLGYQGIVTLLYRTNKISGITANIIYKNDHFEYEEGLDAKLVHKPAMFGKEKGEAIGVYTVAHMTDGAKTFKVMDKDAVMGIKALSKAKKSAESPWNSDKDPEMWMWKKTCLIQHAKLLPKTAELQKALEKDFEGEGMDAATFNVDGPATEKADHKPRANSAKKVESKMVEDEGMDTIDYGDDDIADANPFNGKNDA